MTHSAEDVIAKYIEIRDQKAVIAERHKAELAEVDGKLQRIEGWLALKLQEIGGEAIRTEKGTAFRSTTTRYNVVDWSATLDFILMAGEHQMLVRNVSGKEVGEYAAGHGGALPPGLDLTQIHRINVRRV